MATCFERPRKVLVVARPVRAVHEVVEVFVPRPALHDQARGAFVHAVLNPPAPNKAARDAPSWILAVTNADVDLRRCLFLPFGPTFLHGQTDLPPRCCRQSACTTNRPAGCCPRYVPAALKGCDGAVKTVTFSF